MKEITAQILEQAEYYDSQINVLDAAPPETTAAPTEMETEVETTVALETTSVSEETLSIETTPLETTTEKSETQEKMSKTPFFEPDEEAAPALVVFLHAFGLAEDLAITVLIDADRDKDRDVLDFAVPAAFQVDAINIDISVFAGERAAPPLLDVFVGLLV